MPPLVSALVLNYRSANAAVGCVENLLKQTIADRMEIIVIDNNSEDDSIGILRNRLRQFTTVRIVETSVNHGFGFGYNTGARHACGRYLFINNPDKRLQPAGIETLIARMESDASIGILGPRMMHPDGTRRLSIRRDPHLLDILARRSILGKMFPQSLRRYLMLDADSSQRQVVDWVVGGSFLIRRHLFLQLGGFDERFFLFFEDADLCRRCRVLGKSVVYEPSVVVTDKPRRLSGESLRDLFFSRVGRIHMLSALKYFWKWRGQEVASKT